MPDSTAHAFRLIVQEINLTQGVSVTLPRILVKKAIRRSRKKYGPRGFSKYIKELIIADLANEVL